ncbi:nucleotide exchange factor GrpE [soil metagenome]
MKTQPDIEQPEEQEVPASAEVPVDEVETLKSEVATLKDAVLRARAEMDNYRKRMAREKEEAIRYSNVALLESLIPIVDNFELGLEAAKNATDASGIVMGLGMVRKQLEDFLRSHGVETLDATGQPFDPNLHEAVGHEAHAEVEEGKVISQLRKGYKLKDRLIRPATVVVSKGAPVE